MARFPEPAKDALSFRATHSYARMAPRKAQPIMDLIRGLPAGQALDVLRNDSHRAVLAEQLDALPARAVRPPLPHRSADRLDALVRAGLVQRLGVLQPSAFPLQLPVLAGAKAGGLDLSGAQLQVEHTPEHGGILGSLLEELAELGGMRAGAVKTRLHRARKELGKILGGNLPDGGAV